MNKISILFLFSLFTLLVASPAHATGWIDMMFGRDTDFKPYLENGTEPHNTQWRHKEWQVADWAPTSGDGMAQVDKFVRAGILADYHHANFWRSPTLRVGPSFYHLSGYDQRRVVELFDHVYDATSSRAGTLFVEDDHTGRVIGLYTRAGLQLQ